MNFAASLSSAMCFGCGAECANEELHGVHYELCTTCGDDLAAELAAERDEDLLSDDAIISELLKCGETELADAAERSDRMGAAS